MSEFDVNLISAFAKCPAFYDKSNPNFKDRAFTENAWKEISLQLGFDEKVLRDRMFQLRNRYNLEKRKVEMQDGDPNAKSTWPLFDRMSFLEGHIRPRKSYKSIMNRSLESNDHHSAQFVNNAMFFNHRGNQQMRQYPQHHLAVQNAHNARLQQLANHIQMMANNTDDSQQLDLNGDAFAGIPNNLMMDMFEGDDRTNPLHLFQQQHHQQQQQQQQQLNMHQQQLQHHQRRRDGGPSSENNSEIKAEFYSDSEDDEDGLRDTETDATSKSKEDAQSFSNRLADASTSNQVLGELLGSVVVEESTPNAQPRNGTTSQGGPTTGCDAGNDEEDPFINPMDILMNRQSTGSTQSSNGSNMRYLDTLKRKGEALAHNSSQVSFSGGGHQHQQSTAFKRRRRNYQNMTANGLMSDNNNAKSSMLAGNQHPMIPGTSSHNGTSALLANQAMLLAQLQNNYTSPQTFLQPTPNPLMGNSNATPDKFTAFGQFLASSLSELNGVRALDLIAKFTVEVVDALREQKEASSASTKPSVQQQNHSQQKPEQQQPHQNQTETNSNNINLNPSNSAASSSTAIHNSNAISGDDKYRAHQF